MSSLKLQGATSGEITVTVPSVSGTNTLTLPASTGTVLTDTAPKVGNIIQVVNAAFTSAINTASTSYIVTPYTASITPSSSANKILVMASAELYSPTANAKTLVGLFINGVQAVDAFLMLAHSSTGAYVQSMVTSQYLDSPASTSSTAYTLYLKSSGGGSAYINPDGYTVSVTLMEVAA